MSNPNGRPPKYKTPEEVELPPMLTLLTLHDNLKDIGRKLHDRKDYELSDELRIASRKLFEFTSELIYSYPRIKNG